jgi:hypothetical protein
MKNKVNIIIIAFALATIIGAMIYFVGGMSAANDPIKKYESPDSVEELIQKIKLFKAINNKIFFELKDAVGDSKNGLAFYYDVVLKADGNEIIYNIKFNAVNRSSTQSVLSLIGAHDPTNKIGGYNLNDKGVEELVNKFEIIFIDSLNKIQHTNLKVISNS